MANVLTGHFLKQGNHLLVTLEAIETGTDRLVWQTNLTGSTQDLIGLQEQMAKQVRQGLLPILGAAGGFLETSTRPSNQEAYNLYLRSVAAPHDPTPNRDAIRTLESAVQLDPNYAPAWAEVGQRYLVGVPGRSAAAQARPRPVSERIVTIRRTARSSA